MQAPVGQTRRRGICMGISSISAARGMNDLCERSRGHLGNRRCAAVGGGEENNLLKDFFFFFSMGLNYSVVVQRSVVCCVESNNRKIWSLGGRGSQC